MPVWRSDERVAHPPRRLRAVGCLGQGLDIAFAVGTQHAAAEA